MSQTFISQTTHRRLLKDVKDMLKSPLTEQGIYYVHDDADILQGYALVIGPADTLYADGFYFFKFTFPVDYPFSPPLLRFLTGDGQTRFNPNLYRNGKVCLSILNTWKGEQWTSCQTIRSILLTLVTLFHNNPLLNEPGITKKHHACKPYNEIIRYRNYQIAMLKVINQDMIPSAFMGLFPYIKEHTNKNKDAILKRLNELADKAPKDTYHVSLYNMKCSTDYKALRDRMTLAISDISEN